MNDLHLAGAFPGVSFADWQRAALKALRGGALGELNSALYEGIEAAPLYTAADGGEAARLSGQLGASPFIRGERRPATERPWSIIQFLDHLDIAEANRQLKEDIAGGAKCFWLQFGGQIPYGGATIGARRVETLEKVFSGVALDEIGILISGGFDAIAGTGLMAALVEKRGTPPARLKGSAGLDPLSLYAASGSVPAERERALSEAVDVATYLREKSYGWRPFLVSDRAWHQAGGSAREELAFSLAAAVAYWQALIDAGWPLDEAADAIGFSLTADTDIFVAIAKFRAMRALWARVTEAAGIKPRRAPLIAAMSFRAITERDPHVNLLRATAAAFGAGVGGADAVLLIPFNTRHGTPDAFARRLARNTQLVLQEEAYIGRVADAAGGSWYVESLTHQLAAAAWGEFRAVEATGGLLAALEAGLVERKLTDVLLRRSANLARNRDKITGVSSYPNLAEEPIFSRPEDLAIDLAALDEEGEVPQLPPAGKGKRFGAIVAAAANGATLKGLERACENLLERFDFIPPTADRTAEAFEQLRAASDRAMSRVRARPPIFLANLGALADYNARAGWAKNFFAAGGIEAFDEGGFTDLAKLTRAFQRSPAPSVCICASDKTLAAMPGVAAALKGAGAVAVYLAAEPSALAMLADADKRAIDRIVHDGCNMLKMLTELHHIMRVKELGEVESEEFDEDDDAAEPRSRS
ncbi:MULTISPECIES: methylmalonyl-CoA mutase family protein [Rhodomicrobium]|uniref:methylmalonyl-CoA mutase family protein n=1 Tax=Rhodomicrobium TaxID=1068 RepID=UPI000B4B0D75|nr:MULTISPECIES: methylmalonyl-CoA mutase family protein [Rhodomicrobium]